MGMWSAASRWLSTVDDNIQREHDFSISRKSFSPIAIQFCTANFRSKHLTHEAIVYFHKFRCMDAFVAISLSWRSLHSSQFSISIWL